MLKITPNKTYDITVIPLEQNIMKPVVWPREVNNPRQYVTLSQNPSAAPSGPHVSGMVMLANERLPRSTHCFNVWFTRSALLT